MFLGAFGSVLALAALAGCSVDDVVVLTLPTASPPPGDGACSTNEDCSSTAFCARSACGDAYGACQVRPLFCEDDSPASCGCDGVTYWNDCLRMQNGVSGATPGSCRSGVATCSDPTGADCPVLGASCAKLTPPAPLGMACAEEVVGTCWVLPVECPELGPPERWSSCSDAPDCVDTCGAIRSGLEYSRDATRRCGADGPGGPGGPGRD